MFCQRHSYIKTNFVPANIFGLVLLACPFILGNGVEEKMQESFYSGFPHNVMVLIRDPFILIIANYEHQVYIFQPWHSILFNPSSYFPPFFMVKK